MDEKLRRQLIEAREQLTRQLMQLEAVAAEPYVRAGLGPDNRAVYADLQRELREISQLLGEDEGERDAEEPEPAVHPYYRLSADFNQGLQAKRNGIAIGLAAFTILWLLFLFVRVVIAG